MNIVTKCSTDGKDPLLLPKTTDSTILHSPQASVIPFHFQKGLQKEKFSPSLVLLSINFCSSNVSSVKQFSPLIGHYVC